MLSGLPTSPIEQLVYSNILTTIELLRIGYSDITIIEMEEVEVNRILGVYYALQEKLQERS